jgi:hypothetical protein
MVILDLNCSTPDDQIDEQDGRVDAQMEEQDVEVDDQMEEQDDGVDDPTEVHVLLNSILVFGFNS